MLASGGVLACSRAIAPSHSAETAAARPAAAELRAPPARRVNWIATWRDEGRREELVRDVARDFAFRHPEVDVRLAFPGDVFGQRSGLLMADAIVRMIRSGKIEWDVVWMDQGIYERVGRELDDPDWGARHLVDFAGVPGFAETQKEFIVNDRVYRDATGGILVGPHVEGYFMGLWYDTEVAERVGLAIRERGMTFDDLLGYVERISDYNRTAERPAAAFWEMSDWLSAECLFQNLFLSELGSFEEARGPLSPRKRAVLLKTLRAFEQLGRYDPLVASHSRITLWAGRPLMLQGRALFHIQGTWIYSLLRELDPGAFARLRHAELPVFKEVALAQGRYSSPFAVLQGSPNRADAVALLMSWARPEVAERWARYTKCPTGLRGNLVDVSLGQDVNEQFQAYMSRKYGSRVWQFNGVHDYVLGEEGRADRDESAATLRALLTGRTTAARALAEILGRGASR